jgi:hypothetical protein
MKILILFAVLLFTLIFIFLVPEYIILALFSPILLAVIFIGLNRRPIQRRLDA